MGLEDQTQVLRLVEQMFSPVELSCQPGIVFSFFLSFTILHLFIVYVPWHVCVVCRAEDNWGLLFPSTMWVPGVKLKVIGFVASTFYKMSHLASLEKVTSF